MGILVLTIYLQMPCGEHQVDCTAILPEVALTLRQETVLKMFNESVQENPSQRLTCDRDKGNATAVVTGLSVSLPLVQVDDGGVLEGLRHLPLVPDEFEQVMEFLN